MVFRNNKSVAVYVQQDVNIIFTTVRKGFYVLAFRNVKECSVDLVGPYGVTPVYSKYTDILQSSLIVKPGHKLVLGGRWTSKRAYAGVNVLGDEVYLKDTCGNIFPVKAIHYGDILEVVK